MSFESSVRPETTISKKKIKKNDTKLNSTPSVNNSFWKEKCYFASQMVHSVIRGLMHAFLCEGWKAKTYFLREMYWRLSMLTQKAFL